MAARQEQAPNFKAILDYVQATRPDVLETPLGADKSHFERFMETPQGVFVLALAFNAGRQYQINHPEYGILSFHTDPPLLHTVPEKTKSP